MQQVLWAEAMGPGTFFELGVFFNDSPSISRSFMISRSDTVPESFLSLLKAGWMPIPCAAVLSHSIDW